MPLYELSAASLRGSRKQNEDFLAASHPECFGRPGCVQTQITDERTQFFLICDGLGGETGGAEASRLAAQTVKALWSLRIDRDELPLAELTMLLAEAAHSAVSSFCAKLGARAGTTFSLVVLRKGAFITLNVGDSPILHASSDGQTMTAHALLQNRAFLKKMMRIKPEPNDEHILEYALGPGGRDLKTMRYMTEGSLSVGERLLLCSDGVTNGLTTDQLRSRFREGWDAVSFVRESARSRKADNCSAILLHQIV